MTRYTRADIKADLRKIREILNTMEYRMKPPTIENEYPASSYLDTSPQLSYEDLQDKIAEQEEEIDTLLGEVESLETALETEAERPD